MQKYKRNSLDVWEMLLLGVYIGLGVYCMVTSIWSYG